MAETYKKQAELASKLLTQKGQPITFYKSGGTGYDDEGNVIALPATTAAGNGVVLKFKANQIDGTIIQSQDAYVLYSGVKPDNTMNLDHGGHKWVVIDSEPLQPTSEVILYKVQIR